MAGLGTLINVFAITIGGILGIIFGNRLAENHQKALTPRAGCALFSLGSQAA